MNTVEPACKVSVLSNENWPYKRVDLISGLLISIRVLWLGPAKNWPYKRVDLTSVDHTSGLDCSTNASKFAACNRTALVILHVFIFSIKLIQTRYNCLKWYKNISIWAKFRSSFLCFEQSRPPARGSPSTRPPTATADSACCTPTSSSHAGTASAGHRAVR